MINWNNVLKKSDIVKISILLVVSAGCWIWVYKEFQKPILPEGIDAEYFNIQETPN